MPKIKFPEKLLCPPTHKPFKEPVIAEDGYTYEKEAISRWVAEQGNSPKTQEKISNKFITNWDKKNQIEEFIDEKKICSQEKFIKAVKTGNIAEIKQLNYLDRYLNRLEFI